MSIASRISAATASLEASEATVAHLHRQNAVSRGIVTGDSNGVGLYGSQRQLNASIGSGAFSVQVTFKNPVWTSTGMALWELKGPTTTYGKRWVQCIGDMNYIQFMLRAESGGSTVSGGDATSASSFLTTAGNPFAALAENTVVTLLFTRSGSTLKVYHNGTDITSLFSFSSSHSSPWTSGSVADGLNVQLSTGSMNTAQFQFPKPIYAFKLWTAALSALQAASPDSVSADITGTTAATLIDDQTSAIQALLDELATDRGTLFLPAGKYRVDGTLSLPGNVSLEGECPSMSFQDNRTPTVIVGASASVTLSVDGSEVDGTYNLTPRTSGSGASIYNRNHGGSIRRLSVENRSSGNCLELKYLAAFTVESCYLTPSAGYMALVYACNGLAISRLNGYPSGTAHGVVVFDTADCTFSDMNYGGGTGPVLWLAGNSNSIANSQIWNSASLGTSKVAFTFSGSTVTATSHGYKTGDLVTVTTTGTLPTGLSAASCYWLYKVDANTVRLNTNRDSALAGTGLSLSAGSGTHYIQPGPVANVCIGFNGTQLNNTFTSCRFDQSYESGVVISGGVANSFTACQIIDNWYPNTSQARRPAVDCRNSALRNVFKGCTFFTDRSIGAGVNCVWSADATSLLNFFDGLPQTGSWVDSADVLRFGAGDYTSSVLSGIFEVNRYVAATRSRTSNVATVVTQRAHNLTTGQTVGITGFTDTSFNTNAVAVTVVDAITFTYANVAADVASGADTGGRVTPAKGFVFGSSVVTSSRVVFDVGNLTLNRTLTIAGAAVNVTLTNGGTAGALALANNGGGVQVGASPTTVKNVRHGTATLVGGTVTVADTTITASTRIIVGRTTSGGTLGHLTVSRSAGVSFTVTSSSGTETSVVDYLLLEP